MKCELIELVFHFMQVSITIVFVSDPEHPERVGYIDNVDAFKELLAYEKNATGENCVLVTIREGEIIYRINQETPIRTVSFDDKYCKVRQFNNRKAIVNGLYDAMFAHVNEYFIELWLPNDDLFRTFFQLEDGFMIDCDHNQIISGRITVDVILPTNNGNLRAVHKHTSIDM